MLVIAVEPEREPTALRLEEADARSRIIPQTPSQITLIAASIISLLWGLCMRRTFLELVDSDNGHALRES